MPNFGRGAQDDAVVAAGQRIPPVGETPHALSERERDHQEIDAGRADREQAEERRQRRAEHNARARPRARNRAQAELVARGQDRGEIRAHAEIGGLAERRQAGVAEQDIQAHHQDGENQRARDEQDHERVGVRNDDRDGDQRREHGHDHDLLAASSRRLIPVRTGRSASPPGSAPSARTA